MFPGFTIAEAARKGQENISVASEERGGQLPAGAWTTLHGDSKQWDAEVLL